MKNTITPIISVLLGSVLLLGFAIYNGYPLVTSDSGAYVRFAFDFQVLKDRSSFYCVFIALSGLRLLHTLWVPIFFQSAIVSFLLFRCYTIVSNRKASLVEILFFLFIVAIGTGASWVTSHIMPDIFTAVLLLATILYIYDNRSGIIIRLFYLSLIAISILIHNSHFLIYPLFVGTLLLVVCIRKQREIRNRLLHTLLIAFCCIVSVCWLNHSKGNGWTLSAGSHVFLVGKLVETGVLKQYLDDNCSTQELKMCQYKNELPEFAYLYIWHESPFLKIGGWENSAPEHNKIIKGVFTSPRYTGMFAKKAFAQTIEQLSFTDISAWAKPFDDQSSPYRNIEAFVNRDIKQFAGAIQQADNIKNSLLIKLHFWLFLLSSVWVLILLRNIKCKQLLLSIYALVILYLVCNAFVTATFANVLNRLQNRVFWVLPAINMAVIVQYYFDQAKRIITNRQSK